MMTAPLVWCSPWLDQTPVDPHQQFERSPCKWFLFAAITVKWLGSNVYHVPKTWPSVQTLVQTSAVWVHINSSGAPNQHRVGQFSSIPEEAGGLFAYKLHINSLNENENYSGTPETCTGGAWNQFLFLLLLFYTMWQAHSLGSVLQCSLAVTLLKGFLDFLEVFICGGTVPLRKRSLCSCHDPLWGSYLRLQLLNTSDQNLNAALSASTLYILISWEEAECPFSDVNYHFSPEGKKNAHLDV